MSNVVLQINSFTLLRRNINQVKNEVILSFKSLTLILSCLILYLELVKQQTSGKVKPFPKLFFKTSLKS